MTPGQDAATEFVLTLEAMVAARDTHLTARSRIRSGKPEDYERLGASMERALRLTTDLDLAAADDAVRGLVAARAVLELVPLTGVRRGVANVPSAICFLGAQITSRIATIRDQCPPEVAETVRSVAIHSLSLGTRSVPTLDLPPRAAEFSPVEAVSLVTEIPGRRARIASQIWRCRDEPDNAEAVWAELVHARAQVETIVSATAGRPTDPTREAAILARDYALLGPWDGANFLGMNLLETEGFDTGALHGILDELDGRTGLMHEVHQRLLMPAAQRAPISSAPSRPPQVAGVPFLAVESTPPAEAPGRRGSVRGSARPSTAGPQQGGSGS